MRIALFVNPPLSIGSDFIDYPYFADWGLLASAALVARAGWGVRVVDAFALPGSARHDDGDRFLLGVPNEAVLAALPPTADVVVIGNTPFLRAWRPEPHTVELVAALRARFPSAPLVLADCHFGGMHVMGYEPERVFEALPGLDAIIRYAGDETFSQPERLLDLAGSRRCLDEPARPWPSGHAPPMPLLEAIDTGRLRAFVRSCFRDRWSNPFGVDATTLPLMTSGGCVHRCIFCASNPGWQLTGRKPYRAVPLAALRHWVFLMARALGAKKLLVMDEIANLRPDFEELLGLFEQYDLRYDFPNGLRADYLRDSAIEKMAGRVTLLSVSVESGNAGALQGPIAKRLDPREVERVAATCARVGVPLLVHFIVGFPWETREDVLETLRYAWHLHESYGAQPAVQFATPLKGTPLHDQCLELGLTTEDGADSTDGSLFQHRPAFVPPAIPPGWLEAATGALEETIQASRQRKVIFNITYSCVNNCEFCATGDRIRKFVAWPRIERILREHREAGVRSLDIDGGEPTLHPQLNDTVALARSLGYSQVNVTTNGRKLGDESQALRLLSSGVTSLLISLHGHTAEIHDRITRAPGSFDETVAGIRTAVRVLPAGVDFGVNITISKNNVAHLQEYADLLWELGVRKVNYQFLTPFGNAQSDIVPPPQQAAAEVRRIIERYGERSRIFVVNAQPCLFPGLERYVLADLQKLGRTMVFVWDEQVNLGNYLGERRVRVPECATCAHSLGCGGFFDFGREYAPPIPVEAANV